MRVPTTNDGYDDARPSRCRILIATADVCARAETLEVLWLDGHDIGTATTESALAGLLWAYHNALLQPPDVLVADARFVQSSVLGSLAALSEKQPEMAIVLIAAEDDYPGHAAAIRLDASVMRAPVDLEDLRTLVMNLPRVRAAKRRRALEGDRVDSVAAAR